MKRNVRTDVPFGVAWAERYALLRGIGKTDAEIRRPQVAIISAWSDINNGHSLPAALHHCPRVGPPAGRRVGAGV